MALRIESVSACLLEQKHVSTVSTDDLNMCIIIFFLRIIFILFVPGENPRCNSRIASHRIALSPWKRNILPTTILSKIGATSIQNGVVVLIILIIYWSEEKPVFHYETEVVQFILSSLSAAIHS
jgi:hypothetical protein